MIDFKRIAEMPQVQWAAKHELQRRFYKLAEECGELNEEAQLYKQNKEALLREYADVTIVLASLLAKGWFTQEEADRAFFDKLNKLKTIAEEGY